MYMDGFPELLPASSKATSVEMKVCLRCRARCSSLWWFLGGARTGCIKRPCTGERNHISSCNVYIPKKQPPTKSKKVKIFLGVYIYIYWKKGDTNIQPFRPPVSNWITWRNCFWARDQNSNVSYCGSMILGKNSHDSTIFVHKFGCAKLWAQFLRSKFPRFNLTNEYCWMKLFYKQGKRLSHWSGIYWRHFLQLHYTKYISHGTLSGKGCIGAVATYIQESCVEISKFLKRTLWHNSPSFTVHCEELPRNVIRTHGQGEADLGDGCLQ